MSNYYCRWCRGAYCRGYAHEDSCGARYHRVDGDSVMAEVSAHECAVCSAYACGIHTLADGLCPACSIPIGEAAEALTWPTQIDRRDQDRKESTA